MKEFIDRIHAGEDPAAAELERLIATGKADAGLREYASGLAREATEEVFGDRVYIRGLIEIGNYCRNDCWYCGIRAGNRGASRYRLTREKILDCCRAGKELGFRTFVLQGGEDPAFEGGWLTDVVAEIRRRFPECAVTLSVGERERRVYEEWYRAGAERYLLRHETADAAHYGELHPESLSPENRKRCLWDLREIGYQVGSGFMVGSPGQEPRHLAADLLFLRELRPGMIGIGPFVPHRESRFHAEPPGDVELTLFLLSVLRLLFPRAMLPATTALGTVAGDGRERGLLAGANVVMPNLSPGGVRGKYLLYDDKLSDGAEAAENLAALAERLEKVGRRIVVDRGDYVAG